MLQLHINTNHKQVRGPIVLERYHKADKPCVDADNWFDTGDVASIDRFGVMRIQDRCGGEWGVVCWWRVGFGVWVSVVGRVLEQLASYHFLISPPSCLRPNICPTTCTQSPTHPYAGARTW